MIQFHCTDQANTSKGSYIYILIKIDFYHEKKKKYRNTINEYKKSMFWYDRNIIVLNGISQKLRETGVLFRTFNSTR